MLEVKGGVLCLSEDERKEGEKKSPSLISCLRFCRLERLEEGELPLKLGEAEHSSLCCHCSSSSASFLFPVLILDLEPTLGMAQTPNTGVSVVLRVQSQRFPRRPSTEEGLEEKSLEAAASPPVFITNQRVMLLAFLLEIQLGQVRGEPGGKQAAADQRALLGLWSQLHPAWLWLIPAPEPFKDRSVQEKS